MRQAVNKRQKTLAREKQKQSGANLLIARYKERAPKPDTSALEKVGQYLDGLESDNRDLSDEEEAGIEQTVAELETFLLQRKPFKALKWHLRSLIIPNQRVEQVKASAEQLLDFMFCNLKLEETFARACGRMPDFCTWLGLKIDVLATRLETELRATSPVTDYLRTYLVYLSAQAVQKLSQRANIFYIKTLESPRQEQRKEYSTELRPSQEILEDIMAEKLPEVFGGEFSQQAAWAGLISTKAFREFFADLSDAAYPTFFSECRKTLKAEIDSEVAGPSPQSEERYLLSTLMELQWCSARRGSKFSISVESSDRVPWVDRLKLAIERSSESEWTWWPLSPPPRAQSPAHVQLEPLDMRQQFSRAALFFW
jgi:hypothetical protein